MSRFLAYFVGRSVRRSSLRAYLRAVIEGFRL